MIKIIFGLLFFAANAGAVCTTAATGLGLKYPNYGDRGDVWAKCVRDSMVIMNNALISTTTLVTSSHTVSMLYVKSGINVSTISPTAFQGALTGAASLNVLKTGDFMSGQLTTASSVTATSALIGGVTLNGNVVSTGNYYGNGSNLTGVIPATATGNYPLNAATASALAANPTDCSAGQFAKAIAANGNLTCDTHAGAGDMLLNTAQVVTAAKVFTADAYVTVSSFTSTAAMTLQTLTADTTGYTYVPNGIIIQWGNFNHAATDGTTGSINFPLTFPNNIFYMSISPRYVTGAYGSCVLYPKTRSTASFTWYVGNYANNSTCVSSYWFAIGN
jgi:hypothetical protein